MKELFTSLFYVAAPVGLYLAGLFIFNFMRAMVRVPVYRQRQVSDLKSEIEQLKTQRIQLTVTVHPASPVNPEDHMAIPIFIVNRSSQHRIVLSFGYCPNRKLLLYFSIRSNNEEGSAQVSVGRFIQRCFS